LNSQYTAQQSPRAGEARPSSLYVGYGLITPHHKRITFYKMLDRGFLSARGEGYSKRGKYEILIHNIRWEPEGKIPFENLGRDERTVLKYIENQ
jgi:hypothetical protein